MRALTVIQRTKKQGGREGRIHFLSSGSVENCDRALTETRNVTARKPGGQGPPQSGARGLPTVRPPTKPAAAIASAASRASHLSADRKRPKLSAATGCAKTSKQIS